jgi:D-xylulose kinase
MKNNLFIGIDAGTTSIKGVIADVRGNILAASLQEYTLDMDGDRCEVDAAIYWEKTKAVISELLQSDKVQKEDISALSFASQGETIICIDRNGVPLRKAVVWLDNRSIEEALCIEKHFGREKICEHSGQPQVQPLWPAVRILWLRKNEPEVFNKVHKFLMVEDYLLYKLTGQYVTEQTIVSSTLYYDIKKKTWWSDMLKWLQITEAQLPEVYPPGKLIGKIQPSAAEETGLPSSLQVVAGAYDHVAGALGSGNYKEGVVSETTGTSMAMVVTLDKPVLNFKINIPMQCHVEGKYLLLPYGLTAGLVLKWFKEEFCAEEIKRAHTYADVYDLLTEQARKVSPGSDGLIMLPHLTGSGSPEFNVNARGVFAGITAGMTRAHFIRAILESIAFMIRRNLHMLKDAGIVVREIRVLGGGSKSNLWNQIKADITDVVIKTVQGQETAAMGAVILAATGTGVFSSLATACESMVKMNRTFIPVANTHAVYQQAYAHYVKLSDCLEKTW